MAYCLPLIRSARKIPNTLWGEPIRRLDALHDRLKATFFQCSQRSDNRSSRPEQIRRSLPPYLSSEGGQQLFSEVKKFLSDPTYNKNFYWTGAPKTDL